MCCSACAIKETHAEEFKDDRAPLGVLVSLLKACAKQRDLSRGIRLHVGILRRRLLQNNVFLGCSLVNFYAKCGTLTHAQEVFDGLETRNVAIWNALITGYGQSGNDEAVLKCSDQMQQEGLYPSAITYACILKACGSKGMANKGCEIHTQIVNVDTSNMDVILGTALVDMYAKCGLVKKAQEVFDILPLRNVWSWTVLIVGYVHHDHCEDALRCFELMQLSGVSPDVFTLACVLKACGHLKALDKGLEIHAQTARNGLLEKDAAVGNALMDMYIRCGLLERAQEVLEELPERNLVSWTSLIAGFTHHGYGEEAFCMYEKMLRHGPCPNIVTFTCILKACGIMGVFERGHKVLEEIAREGLLQKDVVVGTAAVDMYGKLGLFQKAQEIFDKLSTRNIHTWNSLLAANAVIGRSDSVFCLLNRMLGEVIEPDLVTFTIVLNTCSHDGLLDCGISFFRAMQSSYGIIPGLEHLTCLVDLVGRAGLLDKAAAIIKAMPCLPNIAVWHTALGACQKWGDLKFGDWAFKNAVWLDEPEAASYVYMSNLYAMVPNNQHVDIIGASMEEAMLIDME